jgi:hypothetical protein
MRPTSERPDPATLQCPPSTPPLKTNRFNQRRSLPTAGISKPLENLCIGPLHGLRPAVRAVVTNYLSPGSKFQPAKATAAVFTPKKAPSIVLPTGMTALLTAVVKGRMKILKLVGVSENQAVSSASVVAAVEVASESQSVGIGKSAANGVGQRIGTKIIDDKIFQQQTNAGSRNPASLSGFRAGIGAATLASAIRATVNIGITNELSERIDSSAAIGFLAGASSATVTNPLKVAYAQIITGDKPISSWQAIRSLPLKNYGNGIATSVFRDGTWGAAYFPVLKTILPTFLEPVGTSADKPYQRSTAIFLAGGVSGGLATSVTYFIATVQANLTKDGGTTADAIRKIIDRPAIQGEAIGSRLGEFSGSVLENIGLSGARANGKQTGLTFGKAVQNACKGLPLAGLRMFIVGGILATGLSYEALNIVVDPKE